MDGEDSIGPATPAQQSRVAVLLRVARFAHGLGQRFLRDRCLERSAALSFTTVMSLIPAAAISLAFLSTVPASNELRAGVEEFLTRYLLPHAGEAVVLAFRSFLAKAGSLTGLGFVGLLLTALMLLATVNAAFDTIWRVNRRRPLLVRLLAYWAILTLGPLLIGGALSVSGFLLATGERYGGAAFERSIGWVTPLIPLLLEGAAFSLLYWIVPNRPVIWRDAICGGVVAAILFEGAKHGLALYVLYFPTYDAIYGALAAIPVFLVWIYLSWISILVGAELAAALPEWRSRGENTPAA